LTGGHAGRSPGLSIGVRAWWYSPDYGPAVLHPGYAGSTFIIRWFFLCAGPVPPRGTDQYRRNGDFPAGRRSYPYQPGLRRL